MEKQIFSAGNYPHPLTNHMEENGKALFPQKTTLCFDKQGEGVLRGPLCDR